MCPTGLKRGLESSGTSVLISATFFSSTFGVTATVGFAGAGFSITGFGFCSCCIIRLPKRSLCSFKSLSLLNSCLSKSNCSSVILVLGFSSTVNPFFCKNSTAVEIDTFKSLVTLFSLIAIYNPFFFTPPQTHGAGCSEPHPPFLLQGLFSQ